jgi:hypothetical protein
MRIMLVVLCSMLLICSVALAKPELEKPVPPSLILTDLVEVEPNDTCQDATDFFNIISPGDSYTSAIDVAGDIDYYEVFLTADGTFRFETLAGDAGDTKMWLYGDDCLTELEYNDDGGEGYYSMFETALVGNTTYYLLVTHYSTGGTGTYLVTMDEIVVIPPPVNDVCEGAIDMQAQSLPIFDVDLAEAGYTDAWSMTSIGCTGFTSPGPDAFYSIFLLEGQTFSVTEDGACDMVMYLFTDCADPETSCVAGSDNCCSGAQELIVFTAEADGMFYLGVDAYTSSGCPVTVTIENPISNEDVNWGTVKSLFR